MSAEGIPVTGVGELVLELADLRRAMAFYAGVLGSPIMERWEQRPAVWVTAGTQTRIGLWIPRVGIAGGRSGIRYSEGGAESHQAA